jgi:hypothetical protein
MCLEQHGLKGTGVIGAYHVRRVAPLMARVLSLYDMAPGVPLNEMVLAQEALRDSEITQCIKDATVVDDLDFVFPISGHLAMWMDVGFVDLVSFSFQFSPNRPSNPII